MSVIIPCYNRGDELRRSLSHLAAQTDRDFNVIVVDDGSLEDIVAIVRAFTDRLAITYERIANSGSPARPRNRGVALSDREWICFLDSDDWWFPDRMARIKARLSGASDILYHPMQEFAQGSDGVPRPVGGTIGFAVDGADPLGSMLRIGNPVAMSGATVRRDLLRKVGGFCEDEGLIEDFDLWLRLAALGARFEFMPKPLGAYSVGGEQISRTARQYAEHRKLYERQLQLLPPTYQPLARSRFEYLLGVLALRWSEPGAADHFRRVTREAGWMTWMKARYRLLAGRD